MSNLNNKVRTLTIIIALFTLCFMFGCEREDNKFKLNDGMKFKEAEKSRQEATGNIDNNQEGQNKSSNKKGTGKDDASMEELSTQSEEETAEKSEDNQEEMQETESQEETQTSQQSSDEKDKKDKKDKDADGEETDDKKSGDKKGGSKGDGKKYTADYNGETLEIYADVEDE